MNRLLRNFLLFISLYLVYRYAFANSFQSPQSSIMSDSNSNPKENKQDPFEGKKKEEIMVEIGGKKFPLSKISKPHAVVHPQPHIPAIEKQVNDYKDSKAFDQAVLDPGKQKQQFDAASFPDVEPEAKKREEELEKSRAKKND